MHPSPGLDRVNVPSLVSSIGSSMVYMTLMVDKDFRGKLKSCKEKSLSQKFTYTDKTEDFDPY